MFSWTSLIKDILKKRPYEDITIPKSLIDHPLESGFIETVGGPQGQIKDYELILPDARRIHVREFEDHYKAHWDKLSPKVDPLGHLRKDAPEWLLFLAGMSGAAIGYFTSKKLENIVYGMLLGVFIGALIVEDQ